VSFLIKMVLNICISLISILPDSWLLSFVWRALYIAGYRKQVINNNFIKAKVDEFWNGTFRDFYKENMKFLARLIVEAIKKKNINDVAISFSGVEKIEELCEKSGGVILLASHYGNWELACSHLPRFTDIKCYGVYKPLKNESFDRIILEKRSKHGLILVPMKSIARLMAENKAKGEKSIYILIADQNPSNENSIIWADFLNIKTAYQNGAQRFFDKYSYSVAYMSIKPERALFNYTVDLKSDIISEEMEDQIIHTYSALLEKEILDSPAYWLWSHKRWKRSFTTD